MEQSQIENLKDGDKLIFIKNGGILSAKKNHVFTFKCWLPGCEVNEYRKTYWQSHEIKDNEHNFGTHEVELFDAKIHKDYIEINDSVLENNHKEFINKYGK